MNTEPIHLFLIHSNASFLCAEALIRHLALDHVDCVFFSMRGYDLPGGYEQIRDIVEYPLPKHDFPDYYAPADTESARSKVKEIDNLVDFAVEGRPFVLYTPVTCLSTVTLIASHPNCVRYNVIEDGLSTYIRECIFNEIRPLPRYNPVTMKKCNDNRLLYFSRSPICVDHPKFDTAYSLCEGGYPGVSRSVVVPDAFRPLTFEGYEKMDASIAFCTTARSLKTDIALWGDVLRKMIEIEFIPRRYKNIAYKHRPCDKDSKAEEVCRKVFREFEGQITFHEIPGDVVMENLIYSYSCPVYFLTTTLGFYATKMGREARSYYHLYAQLDSEFAHAYRNSLSRPEWRETIQLLQDSGTTFMRLQKSQQKSRSLVSGIRKFAFRWAKHALSPILPFAKRVTDFALREEFDQLRELKNASMYNTKKVATLFRRVQALSNEK